MNGWYLVLKTACSQSRLSIHANLISVVHLFIGLCLHRSRSQDHFNSPRMYLMSWPLMNMLLCLPMTKGFFSVLSVWGRLVEKMLKLCPWKYLMQTHPPWTLPEHVRPGGACLCPRLIFGPNITLGCISMGRRAVFCLELQIWDERSVAASGILRLTYVSHRFV